MIRYLTIAIRCLSDGDSIVFNSIAFGTCVVGTLCYRVWRAFYRNRCVCTHNVLSDQHTDDDRTLIPVLWQTSRIGSLDALRFRRAQKKREWLASRINLNQFEKPFCTNPDSHVIQNIQWIFIIMTNQIKTINLNRRLESPKIGQKTFLSLFNRFFLSQKNTLLSLKKTVWSSVANSMWKHWVAF